MTQKRKHGSLENVNLYFKYISYFVKTRPFIHSSRRSIYYESKSLALSSVLEFMPDFSLDRQYFLLRQIRKHRKILIGWPVVLSFRTQSTMNQKLSWSFSTSSSTNFEHSWSRCLIDSVSFSMTWIFFFNSLTSPTTNRVYI